MDKTDNKKTVVEVYCKAEDKVIGEVTIPEGATIDAVSFYNGYENTSTRKYQIDKRKIDNYTPIYCPNCSEILYFKSQENIVMSIIGRLKVG